MTVTFNVCVSILARLPPHQSQTHTTWPCLSAPIRRGPSAQGLAVFQVDPASSYIFNSSGENWALTPGTGGILISVTFPVSRSVLATMSRFISAHQPFPSPSAVSPYVFPIPSAFLNVGDLYSVNSFVTGSKREAPWNVEAQIFPLPSTSTVPATNVGPSIVLGGV